MFFLLCTCCKQVCSRRLSTCISCWRGCHCEWIDNRCNSFTISASTQLQQLSTDDLNSIKIAIIAYSASFSHTVYTNSGIKRPHMYFIPSKKIFITGSKIDIKYTQVPYVVQNFTLTGPHLEVSSQKALKSYNFQTLSPLHDFGEIYAVYADFPFV